MHLTKFMLILILCVGLHDAGFMDRFKSSYNWIYKVDYKMPTIWSAGKKENSTSPETNSTIALNQTEPSLPSLTTLSQTGSTLIANQTEHSPTTLPSDPTEFNSTTGNFSGSSTLSNQTEASMPTTPSNQFSSEQKDRTESNLAFSTENSRPPISIETERNPIETTTKAAEPVQLIETTTITVTLENNSQTKLNNLTAPTSNLGTDPVNLPSSTDPINQTMKFTVEQTDDVSLAATGSTESNSSSSTDQPSVNVTEQAPHDAVNFTNEQKVPTVTPVSDSSDSTISPISKEKTKQPVEQSSTQANDFSSVEMTPASPSSVGTEDNGQKANHSVEQITTQRMANLESSTVTSIQTSKVTKQSRQPTTVRARESTTTASIAKTTRRPINKLNAPINKSNTPIITKFLNLGRLTSGSRAVMKNKEGENDNIIYRNLHTHNFLKEKLDDTFVKFINTFYYN